MCFILLTFRPSSAPSVTSTSKQTSSFSLSTASQPLPSSASKPAPEKEMAYVFILFLQNICLFVLRVQVIHFVCFSCWYFTAIILAKDILMLNLQIPYLKKHSFDKDSQPSKLKFLPSHHLATNSFVLGRLFTNQVTSFKILGAMATKMVATWRVDSTVCYRAPSFPLNDKEFLVSFWHKGHTQSNYFVTIILCVHMNL